MRGNFNCLASTLNFIITQIRKINPEKDYFGRCGSSLLGA